MAAAGAHREARSQEVKNILELAKQHSAIWSQPEADAALKEIFGETFSETEFFLNRVIAEQFLTAWQIARGGGFLTLKALAGDVRGFFSRPVVRAFWDKIKSNHDPRFKRFVKKALKRSAKSPLPFPFPFWPRR